MLKTPVLLLYILVICTHAYVCVYLRVSIYAYIKKGGGGGGSRRLNRREKMWRMKKQRRGRERRRRRRKRRHRVRNGKENLY